MALNKNTINYLIDKQNRTRINTCEKHMQAKDNRRRVTHLNLQISFLWGTHPLTLSDYSLLCAQK